VKGALWGVLVVIVLGVLIAAVGSSSDTANAKPESARAAHVAKLSAEQQARQAAERRAQEAKARAEARKAAKRRRAQELTARGQRLAN
jgi:MFS superfamily sulfate permease-like transporter